MKYPKREYIAELNQAVLDMFPTPWKIESRCSRALVRAKNGVQVIAGMNHTKAAFIVQRVNTHAELLATLKDLLDDKSVTYAVRATRAREAIAKAEGPEVIPEAQP